MSIILGVVEGCIAAVGRFNEGWKEMILVSLAAPLGHLILALVPYPVRVIGHIGFNIIRTFPALDEMWEWVMEFMENEPYEDYTHLDSDAQPEFATELIDMASREGTLMEYDVVVEMEDGTILSPVELSLERTEAAYKAQELVVVEADSLAYGFPDRSLASTIVALTLRCLGPPIYEAKWSFWGRFEKMANKIFPINETTVAQLSLKDSLEHFLSQEYSAVKKRAYQDAYDALIRGDPRPDENKIMAKQEKLGYRELAASPELSDMMQLKTRRIVMVDKGFNIIINAFTLPFAAATQAYTAGDLLSEGPRVFRSKHGIEYAITICGKLTDDEITQAIDWGKGKPILHLIDKGDDNVITYKDLSFNEDIKDCDRSTHTMAQNVLRNFYRARGADEDVLEAMISSSSGRYRATCRDPLYGTVRISYATKEQTTPSGVPDTLERAQYVTSVVFATAVEKITHANLIEAEFLATYAKTFKKAGYKLKRGNLGWQPLGQCTFLSCILHQSPLGTLMVPISPCKLTLMCEGLAKFEKAARLGGNKPQELAMYGIAKSAQMYYRNPLGRILLENYTDRTKQLSEATRLVAVRTYRALTDHRYKVQVGGDPTKHAQCMTHQEYLAWLRTEFMLVNGEVPECLETDDQYFELVDQLSAPVPVINSAVWLAIARLHHA
jgi:hypothetical protein